MNHTPIHERSPWTGEDKSAPHPHLLSTSHTAALAGLRGRLSSGSLLVKCNRPPKQGVGGVITMGCLSWWERGGGCGWKRKMIGCFQK